jgi:hypothetical protein
LHRPSIFSGRLLDPTHSGERLIIGTGEFGAFALSASSLEARERKTSDAGVRPVRPNGRETCPTF